MMVAWANEFVRIGAQVLSGLVRVLRKFFWSFRCGLEVVVD